MDGPAATSLRVLALCLCLFLVPAAGWAVGGRVGGLTGAGMQGLALAGAGCGLLLAMLILAMPALAGQDRARMARTFEPLVKTVMLVLAGSVLVQALAVVGGIVAVELSSGSGIHGGGLLLAVTLGSLAAAGALARSALALVRNDPDTVRGLLVDPGSALVSRVHDLAARLGAERPDHVVVGLEPTFFVTAAPVSLFGQEVRLEGKTLFVSLALMRLLSRSEWDAVIGHELGHFRGEDTAYSMRFAPIYSRLEQALVAMGATTRGAADLPKIPARLALSLCLTRFAVAERTIGRQREILADQAGAEAASPRDLAHALMKVSLFSGAWWDLAETHMGELEQGRTFTRLGETYASVCLLDDSVAWREILEQVGAVVQSHPVDTHPPLVERLNALNVVLQDIEARDCMAAAEPASNLLEEADALDEALSSLEAHWLHNMQAAARFGLR